MDTRQAILDAGLQLFETAGFDRSSVAQVRELAGVSNGSFFHFFASKEALAAALYLQALASYHAAMCAELRPALTAEQGIAQLLRSHLGWVSAQRRQARYLFEQVRADWLSGVRAEQEAGNERFRQAIEAWREGQVAAGQLHAMPVQLFIAQLIGPAQLLCRAWLSGRNPEPPELHAQALIDAACRALLVPTPSRSTRS